MASGVDWVTVSALATAGGTLVLAAATFASVRSANRAARAAERSLLAGLRPLLMPSRPDDIEQKVGFVDQHWVKVPGGCGTAEATDEAVYLTLSVRNAGSGIAVLDGWRFYADRVVGIGSDPDLDEFHRLGRDLYIPAGDVGFWQGALRDAGTKEYADARERIETGDPVTIDVLYGDHEGGQRIVSRFTLQRRPDGTWISSVSRHWNIDREEPREH